MTAVASTKLATMLAVNMIMAKSSVAATMTAEPNTTITADMATSIMTYMTM